MFCVGATKKLTSAISCWNKASDLIKVKRHIKSEAANLSSKPVIVFMCLYLYTVTQFLSLRNHETVCWLKIGKYIFVFAYFCPTGTYGFFKRSFDSDLVEILVSM